MANYVKFMRGSPIAYQQLKEENQLNDDTLYFIYKEDALDGELYLGSKLIAGTEGLASLNDIEINVESLKDKQVLAYDVGSNKWVNSTIEEAINTIFVGATANSSGVAGLVPAPAAGETNLFLRSDGSWVDISADDEPSINLTSEYPIMISENGVITLQIDNATLDVVNNSLTIIGYEAAEDGAVLTKTDQGAKWIVPDNSTLETMSADINKLKNSVGQAAVYDDDGIEITPPSGLYAKISNVEGDIEDLQQSISSINENIDSIEDDVLKLDQATTILSGDILTINGQITNLTTNKANISDVYTKVETLEQIGSAIAAVDHLKRTVVSSTETIDVDLPNADEYIYMIPNAKGTYDEYMVIDGELEKVGDWETDLTGYATKADLEGVNKTIDKLEETLSNEIERAKSAEEANATAISNVQLIANTASTNATAALNQIVELQNTKVDQAYTKVPVIDENSGHTLTEAEFKTGTFYIKRDDKYIVASEYDATAIYYTQVKDDNGAFVYTEIAHTLLTPEEKEKLNSLVIGENGGVEISGTVNIQNVQGLAGYLTEEHFSTAVNNKLNYITDVDPTHFTVTDNQLLFTPTVGRLLTAEDEAQLHLIEAVDNTTFEIKPTIVGQDTDGKNIIKNTLYLISVSAATLQPTLGDLSKLPTIEVGDTISNTIVDNINNIYSILTWGEMTI